MEKASFHWTTGGTRRDRWLRSGLILPSHSKGFSYTSAIRAGSIRERLTRFLSSRLSQPVTCGHLCLRSWVTSRSAGAAQFREGPHVGARGEGVDVSVTESLATSMDRLPNVLTPGLWH